MLRPVASRFALAVLVLSGGLAGAALAQTAAPAADPVVARVSGEAIHRSDVVNFQRQLPPQLQQMPVEALFEPIVERLVAQKLIAAEARKQNLQGEADVKAKLLQMEERVLQEALLNRYLEKAMTDEALHKRFEAYQKEHPGREEIRARHILVANEQAAQSIIADLAKGADFAKIAADRSIDPAGKQSGGDLGFFGKDDMVPEFWTAASALKDGETSKAPVKSQFGWHIIRVEEHRSVSETFEEAREKLASDMSQEVMSSYVEGLIKKAKVERFGLDGKPLPPAAPK
ncbi:MAG: peptidylprolyl isomerase [Alphaproteobacteria bacterium]|nr:peptidylprolyl isomerase [Alphaproteobacteria bacterium]